VAFVLLTFSRVLLAAPNKNTSTVIAIFVGAIITAGAFIVANRPKISSNALAWVLAVAAVVLLGAGVATGVSGERKIEPHQAEHDAGATEETHEETTP
jgi:cytochrome c-type biogenesis protein CcmH/NrfF